MGIYDNHKAWATHDFVKVNKGDMVCIDIKKNYSDIIFWTIYLGTGGTFMNTIPSGEYYDVCTLSDNTGNLTIVAKGGLESCSGSSCKAKIYIDNIRIYSCNDSIKNGDESDVDCGGRCELCEIGKECNSKFDCASHYCNENKTCAEPPSYSYYYNYNFEMEDLVHWVSGWYGGGQDYDSLVTDDWSSEGNFSVLLGGGNKKQGIGVWDYHKAWIVHNITQLNQGDEVCIDMKKNNSIYNYWKIYLYSNGSFLDSVSNGEYYNLCAMSEGSGNLGIVVQGNLDECYHLGQCFALLFIDNITINIKNCTDGKLNRFETDVDCGGFCKKCLDGKNCLYNFDCESNFCDNGTCFDIRCHNNIQDEGEEGIDCGGYCSPCYDENLLEKYAPVLYFHPDEQFFPTTIYAMLNESDLILYKQYWFDETIDEMPVAVESLGYDNVTNDYYLDMRNASGGYIRFNIPDPNIFHKYMCNVYGRVDNRHESLIVLQYWFFYPYNNWYNKHEGDWEMIQIILNKTIEDLIPLVVTYSFHHDANTSDWINIEKIDGTHPKVFVAKGGHASYWDLSNRTYNTRKEEVSQIGPKWIFSEDYVLTEINNSTNWIHFIGIWGEPGSLGTGGPNSPAHVRYPSQPDRWNEPLQFAESTRSSDTIVIVTCPVNLHAYDTKGRHVGLNESGELELEIPEMYLFLDEDELKLIDIVTKEPINFIVEAVDNGTFNLSMNKYDKDTSTQISLEYKNIEITNQTTATINITPTNPNFIMQIDQDGDGTIETTAEPDKITIEGDYMPEETDSDNDGIADSIDNCPNLHNPNQIKDFDGDGFDNLLCGGLDCDDNNESINPNAMEECNNIDDDCNNKVDEVDDDDDNFNDCSGDDLCLNTIPDTFVNLKPNHYSGNWYGCSCTQILGCKPGNNKGELKYGCTEDTIDIWNKQIDWAENCKNN